MLHIVQLIFLLICYIHEALGKQLFMTKKSFSHNIYVLIYFTTVVIICNIFKCIF